MTFDPASFGFGVGAGVVGLLLVLAIIIALGTRDSAGWPK